MDSQRSEVRLLVESLEGVAGLAMLRFLVEILCCEIRMDMFWFLMET